jgi:shikimate kinase
MTTDESPIVFLIGPSGSGKSTVAQWVQEDLGYLHIEVDRWPEGDGIDLEGIRVQWDNFMERNLLSDLAREIRRRTVRARKRGAILSFTSGVVFSKAHIEKAQHHGISIIVLYGTGADCLEAFLRREAERKSSLGVEHWVTNNAVYYAWFSAPYYARHRIMAFEYGKARDRKVIVEEIDQLIRRCR